MSKYLFVETRDPFESMDTRQTFELVKNLASEGHEVALYLTQNGVFAGRRNAKADEFKSILSLENISIYADDYSLEERGISSDSMHSEIKVTTIDKLSELTMEDGRKPIWH